MPKPDPMIYLLVEDDSLELFLNRTLTLTSIRSDSVEVIPCGGWPGVFAEYERLIQSGYNPKHIVPVLDADTIQESLPRERAVLGNPNLFRLSYDLEFAFENWMLAEALLQWSPFGDNQSPQNYLACERLVQNARRMSVPEGGTLYERLVQFCREEYSRQGHDQAAFVPPSKMKLADAVAEIVRTTREFPRELENLITHLENVARTLDLDLTASQGIPNSTITLHSDIVETAKLAGMLLVSVSGGNYPQLFAVDFDKREFHKIREMGYASWSPDGKLIAGMALMYSSPEYKRKSVLLIEENGVEKGWVSTRTSRGSEGHPCWYPDGRSLLLRTDKGTFKASCDAKHWKKLYTNSASHCISPNSRRIARTIYRDGRYFLEISSRGGNEPYDDVPNTTDVRGSVSWSPSGRYLAFVNLISNDIGAVCIYDLRKRTTKFLTSHNGFPYFICFSPDERFILFTWRDRQSQSSLRIVDIESRTVSTVLDGTPLRDPIVGCHAWRATNHSSLCHSETQYAILP